MALPFFRKDRNKPEPKPAPPSEEGPRTTTLSPSMSTFGTNAVGQHGGILVEESGLGADGAIGEAAILYASGQDEGVETLLKGMLAENNPRIWHMLFDFLRLNKRQGEFDRLALDYAMRFECSPPVWPAEHDPDAGTNKAAKSATRALALPEKLEGSVCSKFGAVLTSLGKNTSLQLDFSKVTGVAPEGAAQFVEMLATSRKNKIQLQVSGASSMLDVLRSHMHDQPDIQAYWLMQLALFQMLGKQTEFEDMAVDFAVTFELSPPSWENVQAAQEVAPPEPEIPSDAFALTSIVSESSQGELDKLLQYAESRSSVVIDCTKVTRFDYGYVGTFIGQLMQLLGTGKAITLQGQNALVNELFRTMGIDQLANLVPAKLG